MDLTSGMNYATKIPPAAAFGEGHRADPLILVSNGDAGVPPYTCTHDMMDDRILLTTAQQAAANGPPIVLVETDELDVLDFRYGMDKLPSFLSRYLRCKVDPSTGQFPEVWRPVNRGDLVILEPGRQPPPGIIIPRPANVKGPALAFYWGEICGTLCMRARGGNYTGRCNPTLGAIMTPDQYERFIASRGTLALPALIHAYVMRVMTTHALGVSNFLLAYDLAVRHTAELWKGFRDQMSPGCKKMMDCCCGSKDK